jgi:hypothetical protein
MKSFIGKIIVALILAAALAGCATTGGDQETAMQWLDRMNELPGGD